MKSGSYIEVAVALPLFDTFVYRLPPDMEDAAAPGTRVLVPFGKRSVTGYVLGPGKPPEGIEVKDIADVLDERPAFPAKLLDDLKWMSDYYLWPLGETLKSALPAGINVESSPSLLITPEGEKALADTNTRASDRELLAKIAPHPGIRQKNLKGVTRARINRLARLGWIVKEEKISKAMTAPRSVTMVSISPTLENSVSEMIAKIGKRAPARARALAYLDSTGEVPLAELSKTIKNASAIVKALENDGLVVTRKARAWRDPWLGDVPEYEGAGLKPAPTQHQQKALDEIIKALSKREFATFLLHGVTGSGKTEVYLRAIAAALDAKRESLVLVPEIALTPQLVGRFRARFGSEVAVLHSAMGRGERLDEWTRVREKKVRVAIGARSAVFAPFDNLGLIVVDEEHDGGYKQEDKITYNARDFAIVRARSMNAIVVLGSATPSLESYRNALEKKYRLLELPERVESRPLPGVEIVDLRDAKKGRSQFISTRLEEEILANFDRGRQTILFLNRRGYAPFLMCVKCGHTFGCPNCSVSLTFHQRLRMAVCHFCDYRIPPPNLCPECNTANVKMVGFGTERVEEEVKRLIPAARVGRLDRDSVSRKGELERIIGALRDGSLDILVGTQMVAKGHDYPGVTLVGVLMAETSLNFPDFRAAENTFDLITQVAGRAGRGEDSGKVIVQTYNPEHYAIKRALEHDYEGFVKEELENRRELDYPPFTRLVAVRISGSDQAGTRRAALSAGEAARKCKGVKVMGPAPAPWAKIKNQFRWHILIKSTSAKAARETARYAIAAVSDIFTGEHAKISVDVDPLSFQ